MSRAALEMHAQSFMDALPCPAQFPQLYNELQDLLVK